MFRLGRLTHFSTTYLSQQFMMLATRFPSLLWTICPQFLSATTAAEQYQTNTMITAMCTERHIHHCVLQNAGSSNVA